MKHRKAIAGIVILLVILILPAAAEQTMDPDVILFVEPTSAPDPTTIGEVLTVIRNLKI